MSRLTTKEIIAQLLNPTAREELLNSWPRLRCSLCRNRAATGIWMCHFSASTELKILCPACGFTDCYIRWNGFMCPKLLRCDLAFTITAVEGDKTTPSERLIARIKTHPLGEKWIAVWRAHYKPANISHPIEPAMLMLRAISDKLFPPTPSEPT